MQFESKPKEELGYLAPGEATFKVIEAQEGKTKNRAPMLIIDLKIWDKNKKEGMIKDWLISSFPSKIYKFCNAIGSPELYENGNLSPFEIKNKTGRCRLKLGDNDYTNVAQYLTESLPSTPKEEMSDEMKKSTTTLYSKDNTPPPIDDDLPF